MSIVNKDPAVDVVASSHQKDLENGHLGDRSATFTDDTIAPNKQHDSSQSKDVEDYSTSAVVNSLKLSSNEPGEQQYTPTAPVSSLTSQDCVLVIIIPSSTIDKHVTIKGLEQDGYTTLDQRCLQLSPSHIDTLYTYDPNTTKPHYQQLYDGWKQACTRDPVQVVLLGKDNAVQSFQALVTHQNSTKKKNRILDPQSVYASTSPENVKRDINMLLVATQGSNKEGESVSSATTEEGVDNKDDTVVQSSSETTMPDPISTENNQESNFQPSSLPLPNTDFVDIVDQDTIPDTTTDHTLQRHPSPPPQEPDTMATLTNMDQVPFDNPPSLDTLPTPEPETDVPTNLTIIAPAKSLGSIHSQDSDAHLTESTASLPSPSGQGPIINDEASSNDDDVPVEDPTPTKSAVNNSSDNTSSNNTSISTEDQDSASPIDGTFDPTNDTTPLPPLTSSIETKKTPVKKKESGVSQGTKKKQPLGEGRSKKVATSDTKAPSPPAKSKLRTTTARSTTSKPTLDKQQDDSGNTINKKRGSTDETKKKINRIPRVAHLATPPATKPSPSPTDDPQDKVKQKSKITRGSIARLSAPTASSARRRQSTSSPQAAESTKGTGVTTTVKLDQKKKRSETAPGTPIPTSNTPTTIAEPVTTTETTPKAASAPETVSTPETMTASDTASASASAESSSSVQQHQQQQLLFESKDNFPDSPKDKKAEMPRRVGQQMLIIKKAKATTGAPDTTTTATATIAPPLGSVKLTEKDRPTPLTTTQPEHPNEKEQGGAPQSPAESSTTSSRPHTPPVHNPQGSPTTTATTTTGLVTLDATSLHDQPQQLMDNTSKVKDILGRFI